MKKSLHSCVLVSLTSLKIALPDTKETPREKKRRKRVQEPLGFIKHRLLTLQVPYLCSLSYFISSFLFFLFVMRKMTFP